MIVEIDKINETKLRVLCPDEDVARKMKQYFSFFPPGLKFSKKYKNARGAWDGSVSLFDMHSGLIGHGLLPYVEKFCVDNELEVQHNFEKNYNTIPMQETLDFLDTLNTHTKGEPLEFRDYQIEAINYACSVNRALIISPTASGKSSIIYAIIRNYLSLDKRVLLIVPSVSLVLQMLGDFKDYSSQNHWDAEKECGIVYANTERNYDRPVQIGTWQSFKDFDKEFFEDFDVVIGDEAHQFAAKEVSGVLNKCVNAYARFGTTGTLKHGPQENAKQLHSLQVQAHFGAIYKTISTREMIDQGYSVDLDFKAYLLKYSNEEKTTLTEKDYRSELDWLASNRNRNNFIAKLAKSLDGNVLILFNYVEKHGIPLYTGLKKYLPNRHVAYVSGKTKVDVRESVRDSFQEKENVVAVCSYGTFSTGINAPNIRHIIFADPFLSRIRLFQSIGRGLRLYTGKAVCTVHDIGDDLRMNSDDDPNTTLRHMKERILNLESEDLNVELIKYKFK